MFQLFFSSVSLLPIIAFASSCQPATEVRVENRSNIHGGIQLFHQVVSPTMQTKTRNCILSFYFGFRIQPRLSPSFILRDRRRQKNQRTSSTRSYIVSLRYDNHPYVYCESTKPTKNLCSSSFSSYRLVGGKLNKKKKHKTYH